MTRRPRVGLASNELVRRRYVDDADLARLEAVAFELAEQRQARRLREHVAAHERRAVADDEHVEARGELAQLGLRAGVALRRMLRVAERKLAV